MLRIILTTIATSIILFAQAQNSNRVRLARNIQFADSAGYVYKNALAGGLNNPQFSTIDLNNDGLKDLFVFEKRPYCNDAPMLTFINEGLPGDTTYRYAPEYISRFPKTCNFMLLRDYNNDGIEDIFAFSPFSVGNPPAAGIQVLKGSYDANNIVQFELIVGDIRYPDGSFNNNIYVLNDDIPAIDDIDNDGDMDILNFNSFGGNVEYFKCMSVERYGRPDSLEYIFADDCWGRFQEPALVNTLVLSPSIRQCMGAPSGWVPRHAGSTIATIDMNNDGDKEIVLGDINFNNLVTGYNGGTIDTAWVTSEDTAFPSNSVPVDVLTFPVAFFEDVNNDSKPDLIASPNKVDGAENKEVAWYYENVGTGGNHVFELRKKNFLGETMVDHGANSHPRFFDENNDGLLDIVVGNYGYYRPQGRVESTLLLFRNVGTASNPSYRLVTSDYAGLLRYAGQPAFTNYVPAFGDMDSDGDQDMILGNEEGTLYYMQNTAQAGQPAVFNSITPNWFSIDVGLKSAPTVYDYNSDGKLDLIVGRKLNAGFFCYKNKGSNTSPNFNSTPSDTLFIDVRRGVSSEQWSAPIAKKIGTYEFLWIGNFNGDVVLYDTLRNPSTGVLRRIFPAPTAFGNINVGWHSSLDVNDINGDGKLDYIVGNNRGGLTMYSEGILTSLSNIETTAPDTRMARIFPNPADKVLTVEFSSEYVDEDATVRIFDVLGRMVVQETINGRQSFQINLPNITSGLYFTEIINGNVRQVEKLVVR